MHHNQLPKKLFTIWLFRCSLFIYLLSPCILHFDEFVTYVLRTILQFARTSYNKHAVSLDLVCPRGKEASLNTKNRKEFAILKGRQRAINFQLKIKAFNGFLPSLSKGKSQVM